MTVKANVVHVTGVKLNKTTISKVVGQTEQLTATVLPENATNKAVTWSSSNTTIATVDANGKVTAKKVGTAKITVTTKDGNKMATCTVTVKANVVHVTGVKLNKTAVTKKIGETEQLTATVAPANATNKAVTWSSSNNAVATVTTNGKKTTDGNKTATCTVTVKANVVHVTGVTLNKTAVTKKVGQTEQLTATVAPANATNKAVTWSSSNAAVATVGANGKVTAKKAGTAKITVTTEDGNKTANCTVTVKANVVHVMGVKLNKTTITKNVGETELLKATVFPSNATNQAITWKSSDNAVATVNANGKVTAVAEGTATITVTTEDGNKTAICTVKVEQIHVTSVKVRGSSEIEVKIGTSVQFEAIILPNNATNQNVSWEVTDTYIGSITANGKFTAKNIGTTNVVVTTEDGGKTATVEVKVVSKSGSGDAPDMPGEDY